MQDRMDMIEVFYFKGLSFPIEYLVIASVPFPFIDFCLHVFVAASSRERFNDFYETFRTNKYIYYPN